MWVLLMSPSVFQKEPCWTRPTVHLVQRLVSQSGSTKYPCKHTFSPFSPLQATSGVAHSVHCVWQEGEWKRKSPLFLLKNNYFFWHHFVLLDSSLLLLCHSASVLLYCIRATMFTVTWPGLVFLLQDRWYSLKVEHKAFLWKSPNNYSLKLQS